jgi:hypothetical protein
MKFIPLILLIFLLVTPVIGANNTTVNMTSNETYHIMPAPEEFYGNVTYTGSIPVVAGSEIIAMNQLGKIVGNFTMTENGVYGDRYKSAPKLIIRADTGDVIAFYINNAKSLKTMIFDSGATKRYDVVIPLSARPTQNITPSITHNITLNPTPVPSVTRNITANPIILVTRNITPNSTPTPILTINPTPRPTTGVLINNIPTPTPTPVPIPVDTTTPKFLGILLISIAICIFGAILTYFILTKKMKRDDDEEIIL